MVSTFASDSIARLVGSALTLHLSSSAKVFDDEHVVCRYFS